MLEIFVKKQIHEFEGYNFNDKVNESKLLPRS